MQRTRVAADKKDAVVRFLQYAMNPDVVSADPGRISSVPGVRAPSRLTEMAVGGVCSSRGRAVLVGSRPAAQVTTPLNDTIQKFFLPGADVKQALTEFELLVEENMGPAAN